MNATHTHTPQSLFDRYPSDNGLDPAVILCCDRNIASSDEYRTIYRPVYGGDGVLIRSVRLVRWAMAMVMRLWVTAGASCTSRI